MAKVFSLIHSSNGKSLWSSSNNFLSLSSQSETLRFSPENKSLNCNSFPAELWSESGLIEQLSSGLLIAACFVLLVRLFLSPFFIITRLLKKTNTVYVFVLTTKYNISLTSTVSGSRLYLMHKHKKTHKK